MEKARLFLEMLKEKLPPHGNGNHGLMVDNDGNLVVQVFYNAKFYSGTLVHPVNLQEDIQSLVDYVLTQEGEL